MDVPEYTFDKARLRALGSYGILDTPPEPGFDDIVSLAANLCETPFALVSLVAGNRQWFKAKVGLEACETGLGSSVCAYALVEPDLLVIPDLTADPRTHGNPLVRGEPHIRFYAGAPLRTSQGHVLGSLCVIDVLARPGGLTPSQAAMLQALARQTISQLELRRAVLDRDRAIALQQEHEAHRVGRERDFRHLFDAIDDGFCIVEVKFDGTTPVDYRFVETNSAFVRQTGLADANGKWMRDLAPDHEQHWFDLYGQVALTGEPARFENPARELGDRWYDVHAFRIGNAAARHVGVLFNDVSTRKTDELIRQRTEALQKTLNQELSHRMKNIFAMVQAIASQTLRTAADQELVQAFTARVLALSTAHDVLLQQSWSGSEIGTLVRTILSSLAPLERFDIAGPRVLLGARSTLSVTMILHELTANALKYGALSNDAGRVSLWWAIEQQGGEDLLTLKWRETGGPPVKPPGTHGFGSKLIRTGLAGTGGAEVHYHQSGFEARFVAPIDQVQGL